MKLSQRATRGLKVAALVFICLTLTAAAPAGHVSGASAWWLYPAGLFLLCFAIGCIAVMAGVGGGVFYVPLVSSLFPFHLDFVRAAGIMLAAAGAMAAGPRLLRKQLASLRLALPLGVIASIASIAGALAGLSAPTHAVELALGVVVILSAALMAIVRSTNASSPAEWDRLGAALRLEGAYSDEATGKTVPWRARRTPLGLALFVVVGFLGGMFGMGAGWASVPVLALVMGVPIKVAAGTSNFLVLMTGVSAFWVYLNKGCVIPLLAVPSMLGLMLGALVSAKLLGRMHERWVRLVILVVLMLAGVRMILKSMGI